MKGMRSCACGRGCGLVDLQRQVVRVREEGEGAARVRVDAHGLDAHALRLEAGLAGRDVGDLEREVAQAARLGIRGPRRAVLEREELDLAAVRQREIELPRAAL